MRKTLFSLMIFLVLLIVTGCWDIEEVDDRANANAIFFDTTHSGRFKMGAAIHIPGTIVPPAVGTAQQLHKRHYSVSAEGNGLLDAWSKLQSVSMRNLFFSHVGAIILSESFAKGDIRNLLDFISRRVVVPADANLLVAKSDPADLLKMKNNNNMPPGTYINSFFNSKAKQNLALPMALWEINKILDNQTQDPYIPMVDKSQGNYKIAGVALFSKNHKVGELTADETEILALLQGTDAGYLSIPYDDHKLVAYSDVGSDSKIEPDITNKGDVSFNITTKITGRVGETLPHKNKITTEQQKVFKQLTERYTKHKLTSLIDKLQGLNSDPVGFGGKLRIKYPQEWEKIDWHEVYPDAKFNVKTEFQIESTNLIK